MKMAKIVALGSDPNAIALKNVVKEALTELGYEYYDFGSDDTVYANVAIEVAESVASGEYAHGILMCGTGIGMSIAANKVQGAYAALCSDVFSAERARKSNNANIMTMGSQVIGVEIAKLLVKTWMESEYVPGGRSEPKVNRIKAYESEANESS
jgi:ribose 5-phosphate isomerase B